MNYYPLVEEDLKRQREAILAHMVAGLPGEHRNALEVLNRVNETYVESGRDTVVKDVFDQYLAFCAAEQRYGRTGKGQAFYVTGDSGAGKTDIVENLLKTHPSMQPVQIDMGVVSPWVSVSLSGPATLAGLGKQILRAAGYKVEGNIKQSRVFLDLPTQMLERGVAVIHIDETQHLMANKAETSALVNSLKGLMNSTDWPLRMVLSGMPETNEMLDDDKQGERRNFSVVLPPISLQDELFLAVKIIQKLCAAAGLDCAALIDSDLPERIVHAADYQFGRVCEVTAAGIYDAILHPSKETAVDGKRLLERDHLARAYILHSHARGFDDMNPFLVDGWAKLKPGYFIINPKKYKA